MTQIRTTTEGYFGNRTAAGGMSVPAIAGVFGFTIMNRRLQRKYFKGLRGTHVPFQYIEQVPTRSKSANYEELEFLGRFESMPVYKNSSNEEYQLQLKYYAEGSEELEHNTFWTVEQIERIVYKLQALVAPKYDGAFSPPDKVLLNIGSIFVDVPVVVKQVQLNFKPPYDTKSMQSRFIEATVDVRTAYPLYQAIGANQMYAAATDRVAARDGNKLFAYKKFNTVSSR